MKKYIFSIISIIIGVIFNLTVLNAFIDSYFINIFLNKVFSIFHNIYEIYIIVLISILFSIISLKKYKLKKLSIIGLILNILPLSYTILLAFALEY